MNTNNLKRFAQEARRILIEQVGAKMEFILNMKPEAYSAELREKAWALRKLQEAINTTSKEQVIDKVAYTWFNRLMALRFMDANDYQPIGIRVVTPKDGHTLPEILDEAKQGNIPDDLPVKPQHIYDLLDGKIPAANPQNEAYKELLIGACNYLNKVFPFLFERINDYAELLLPDDLTSEFSIVHDMREGMTTEDCQQVEIIGWLYQFYISEKKDEVFASKSKVRKEDIPAATQLFTPRWIVEYMVQNTVGKLWLQNKPNSRLREHMPYFIESPSVTADDYLKVNSVEEITLLDQACGSGHILVYGFELFTKIYEEEGYNPSEIPQLIIEKNLHGFEIDERAAQLAGMALMMKARSYHRRFFRNEVKPNILCFKDIAFTRDELMKVLVLTYLDKSSELQHDIKVMENATNFGSLIVPQSDTQLLNHGLEEIAKAYTNADLFERDLINKLSIVLEQLLPLNGKYHCVVDNPPYMGGGNMNKELGGFVKKNYPDSKADLMACFMESGLQILHLKGFLGMINQHSWMFLSSYEKLRGKLIRDIFYDTLLHLGPRTFPEIGGEVVQNTSFTFCNTTGDEKGKYIRLVDYGSSELKRNKTLEAKQNPNCNWSYTANQKDFKKITGNPIGYFLNSLALKVFEEGKPITELCEIKKGISTGNNGQYLRFFFEVNYNEVSKTDNPKVEKVKWHKANKGGEFQKYFGNQEYVVNWGNNGEDLKSIKPKSVLRSLHHFYKPILAFSKISSSSFSLRHFDSGFISIDASSYIVEFDNNDELFILGVLNSCVFTPLLGKLTPTLNFEIGDMSKFPIPFSRNGKNEIINDLVAECVSISRHYDKGVEASLNFTGCDFFNHLTSEVKESYDLYQQYWKGKFSQLHQNEEELNHQFIEIYGLQEELTHDVPLDDITILKEETKIVNNELVFNAKEVMAKFVSYVVGCMFGRYSLDKPGLILANQGETLEDYIAIIANHQAQTQEQPLSPSGGGRGRFIPDEDNIIPILNDEWFEDDITGRFHEFLKVSFGKENFEKNLHFIEDALGKDIRKYFVKDFYPDHIKRYKKRPIYWMFSSPGGSFSVLIYMHRYNQDTLNEILNGYLKEYREKLNTHMEHLDHIIVTGTSSEQTKASKEKDKLRGILRELQEYERDILYPLATERISIDLDDGVLVNYNKFGKAIKTVTGLNDAKTKKKVMGFDWIDTTKII